MRPLFPIFHLHHDHHTYVPSMPIIVRVDEESLCSLAPTLTDSISYKYTMEIGRCNSPKSSVSHVYQSPPHHSRFVRFDTGCSFRWVSFIPQCLTNMITLSPSITQTQPHFSRILQVRSCSTVVNLVGNWILNILSTWQNKLTCSSLAGVTEVLVKARGLSGFLCSSCFSRKLAHLTLQMRKSCSRKPTLTS